MCGIGPSGEVLLFHTNSTGPHNQQKENNEIISGN